MRGVKILDGTEAGRSDGLSFDLAEVLVALGKPAIKSRWSCAALNYISRDDTDVEVLERATTPGQDVSGKDLIDGIGQSLQVIDGRFTGMDEDGEAWVVIRAVDSTRWEVWSDNPWVHEAICASFRVVESIPDDPARD